MNEQKKFKLSKENATKEFNKIVECFNFNISTDLKENLVTMKIGNIDMQMNQEFVEADAFINKIMEGKIKFDEDRKKIIFVPTEPIITGNENNIVTSQFEFGKFTRATQKSIRVENKKGKRVPVQLNEINFATMDDDKAEAVIMAMTGISEIEIFNKLEIPDYNDLRMISGYFFQ